MRAGISLRFTPSGDYSLRKLSSALVSSILQRRESAIRLGSVRMRACGENQLVASGRFLASWGFAFVPVPARPGWEYVYMYV